MQGNNCVCTVDPTSLGWVNCICQCKRNEAKDMEIVRGKERNGLLLHTGHSKCSMHLTHDRGDGLLWYMHSGP